MAYRLAVSVKLGKTSIVRNRRKTSQHIFETVLKRMIKLHRLENSITPSKTDTAFKDALRAARNDSITIMDINFSINKA